MIAAVGIVGLPAGNFVEHHHCPGNGLAGQRVKDITAGVMQLDKERANGFLVALIGAGRFHCQRVQPFTRQRLSLTHLQRHGVRAIAVRRHRKALSVHQQGHSRRWAAIGADGLPSHRELAASPGRDGDRARLRIFPHRRTPRHRHFRWCGQRQGGINRACHRCADHRYRAGRGEIGGIVVIA